MQFIKADFWIQVNQLYIKSSPYRNFMSRISNAYILWYFISSVEILKGC
jgi:hypothetical protein